MTTPSNNHGYFLSGKDIYLREVRASDVNDQYYKWINDPAVNQYLETRFVPRSIDNILGFVQAKDGDQNEPFFAICCQQTHQHIGNIKLGPINWAHRRADISLLIGNKAYWGKGIATQAIELVTDFAFNQLNLNKLQAGAYHQNQGSIKAFLKNGFVQEGYVKEICLVNGQPVDMVLLGLTLNDFRGAK